MEVVTDSKSSTPVLLPNAEFMEMLERDVNDNKKRMAKEARKQKQRGRNDRDNRRNNDSGKIKSKFEHRDWIQEHVLEYLKSTPCVNIPTSKLKELKSKCMSTSNSTKKKRRSLSKDATEDPAASLLSPTTAQTPATTESTSSNIGYGLTEAEAIQILNFMPQEPVEIHLMIEDLHARMSETKQGEFLDMIRSYNTSVETNNSNDNDNEENQKEPTEEVVVDSIEMLEKAGNQTMQNDGDTDVMIKEEIWYSQMNLSNRIESFFFHCYTTHNSQTQIDYK